LRNIVREIKPEFHRPVRVDRIPKMGSYEKIATEPKECAALAKRLGLGAVHSIKAEIRATPWRGGGIKLSGSVAADIEQTSVVSLETFRSVETFKVERYYLPEGSTLPGDESEEDIDVIHNGEIDLGEVVVETIVLDLDPYPRKPNEEFSGFEPEEEAVAPAKISPFAALKKPS
jgi:uncharacterized metal-binding protein YceD (DUF177 family)